MHILDELGRGFRPRESVCLWAMSSCRCVYRTNGLAVKGKSGMGQLSSVIGMVMTPSIMNNPGDDKPKVQARRGFGHHLHQDHIL